VKNNIKFYLLSLILLVTPIILANVYYIDDIGRSILGYTFWGTDGRPLADYIMSALMFNVRMVDIAPLPLLISCLLLSVAFYIFHKKFLHTNKFSNFIPLAFLLNPFLMEIFSYRFDSLTINSAIFLCFAFISVNIKHSCYNPLFKTLLTIGIFSLYQPVINTLVVFLVIELLHGMEKKKTPVMVFKQSALSLISLILGASLYLKVVLPLTLASGDEPNHPRIAGDVIDKVISNGLAYLDFINKNIAPEPVGKFVFPLAGAISLTFAIILAYRYYNAKKSKSGLAISLLAIIAMMLAPIGALSSLLLLENPLTNFARVYIGISAYMLLLFFSMTIVFKDKIITSIIVAVLFLYVLVFSFAYGNALKSQDALDKNLVQSIKVETKGIDYNVSYIVFNGSPPLSKVLSNTEINFPLIRTLVITYFGNWMWAYQYMVINGLTQKDPGYGTEIVNSSIIHFCEFELVSVTQDFEIYKKDSVLVINFEKNFCKK